MFSSSFCFFLLGPPPSGVLVWDWMVSQRSEVCVCLKTPPFHLHSSIIVSLGLDALFGPACRRCDATVMCHLVLRRYVLFLFGSPPIFSDRCQEFPFVLEFCCSTGTCLEWISFPFPCSALETSIQSKDLCFFPILKYYQLFSPLSSQDYYGIYTEPLMYSPRFSMFFPISSVFCLCV